jgi:hypothetical protein
MIMEPPSNTSEQSVQYIVEAVQGLLAEYKEKRAVLEHQQADIVEDFSQALQKRRQPD